MRFHDRNEAGNALATRLEHLRDEHPVVLGLPRGGVPVAAAVAAHLDAPLDVLIVRKVGVPHQPELAMGAIGEGGVRVVNDDIVTHARVTAEQWDAVERREWAELERRAESLRGAHPRVPLDGRVVVIVDDGLATGSTARAACRVARAAGARRVVLAVPLAPPGWTRDFEGEAEELVAVLTPEPFRAVGQWYDDFGAVPDEMVERCLDENARLVDRRRHLSGASPGGASGDPAHRTSPGFDGDVQIPAGAHQLGGHLTVPPGAAGVVLFAHGSGSSRHSPRNQQVARLLQEAGLGTLLFDLLVPREADDRRAVFDIELLAGRLVTATAWLQATLAPNPPPLGFFGASTGAAAALWAATETPVAAVVSRGGRPDLAAPRLGQVHAPTLLVVGSEDHTVLELNRSARDQMTAAHTDLRVIPGASHLFEEPGTLDEAAAAARDWFLGQFAAADSHR
jgi:putative phosphoribosyl transferase